MNDGAFSQISNAKDMRIESADAAGLASEQAGV
jgi:hypothetical protein